MSDSATARLTLQASAMATLAWTNARPSIAGRNYSEIQVVQPNAMLDASWRALSFNGTLNGEGYTLRRGELNAGIFGEGYVDRRHPHTLVHEAMLVARTPAISVGTTRFSASLSAGKGFVAFGSDDPMMRPIEKYPANHHHAQILERVQTVGAIRAERGHQWVTIEGTTFNGDEPAGPFHGPVWSRFGDSWSLRSTAQLIDGLELSVSKAYIVSPEIQQGGAFDHAQHHVSARFDRSTHAGNARYALVEWARTDEITRHETAFRYQSWLAEGAIAWRGVQLAGRAEDTDRSEQTRLRDPFRAPLGHIDFQILGVTQWRIGTVSLSTRPLNIAQAKLSPFIEIARASASPRNRPTVFEPVDFYGRSTLWSYTVGVRTHVGRMRHRMGHYGVANTSTGMDVSSMSHMH